MPPETAIEALSSPSEAHEIPLEYNMTLEPEKRVLGANLSPDVPRKKADFPHSDLQDYVTQR